MKSQKVQAIWSALAAVSFAGCAQMVYCWSYPQLLASAAWIPWIFLSIQASLGKKGFIKWTLPLCFLSLQLLAGYPFFTFYTFLILIFWFEGRHPTSQDRIGFWITLIFSAFLAAGQWLPFLEYLTFAERGGWWTEYPYYLKPVQFLTLLHPELLGDPSSNSYRGVRAAAAFNLYCGIPVLVGWTAGGWGFWGRKFQGRFWLFSAMGLLLWMSGFPLRFCGSTLGKLLESLDPEKASILFIFCAITFGASAFQRWLDDWEKGWKGKILFFVFFLWMVDIFSIPFLTAHRIQNPFEREENRLAAERIKNVAGHGRILSAALPSQLSFSGPNSIDLALESPVQKFLADSNGAWDIRSVNFYFSLWPETMDNLSKYTFRGFPYNGDLLDVAGVRIFLLPQVLAGAKYHSLGKMGNQFLNFNSAASEDLRMVPGKEEFLDRSSLLNVLARPDSGWRQKVFLEKSPDENFVSLPPAYRNLPDAIPVFNGDSTSDRSYAGFAGWRNVGQNQPGFIVFNETYAPGWHAWVDGAPRAIWRAYGLFMAVNVEKGVHQVDFRYEPASFRLGLFLSLTVFSLVLGLFLGNLWRAGFRNPPATGFPPTAPRPFSLPPSPKNR